MVTGAPRVVPPQSEDDQVAAARRCARRRAASHTSAAPASATGTIEPRFSQVQPCVVTSAPEPSEVSVIVAITVSPDNTLSMRPPRALCPEGFALGRVVGPPRARAVHRAVVQAALGLLAAEVRPGRVVMQRFEAEP